MFTQTRPLLRSCIVRARAAVCHAGAPRLRLSTVNTLPSTLNGHHVAMRGCTFFWRFLSRLVGRGDVSVSSGRGVGGRLIVGRTVVRSAAQLRQLFCPAHGSVPAVLQRKAPLPPLCIMTNQGRQAAVPLAHHSTAQRVFRGRTNSQEPCGTRDKKEKKNIGRVARNVSSLWLIR